MPLLIEIPDDALEEVADAFAEAMNYEKARRASLAQLRAKDPETEYPDDHPAITKVDFLEAALKAFLQKPVQARRFARLQKQVADETELWVKRTTRAKKRRTTKRKQS